MIIENLNFAGFRNLERVEFSFCKNKNLIYGLNGTGKTTILEAIFIAGFGKSFLNVKKKDIVNYKSDEFLINLVCKNNRIGQNKVSAFYNNKFSLLLNGKKTNIFEVNKFIYPLFFSSANYNVYIESKPFLRKLMNRFIFGVYSLYIHYILSYNRALKQKNYLLKTKRNFSELSSWNRILSEFSEKIGGIRMEFINKLNIEIKNKYNDRLEIHYIPSLFSKKGRSKDDLFIELEKIKDQEIKLAKSLKGPHLDSFEIYLNSRNLKFNSSGEKKINLLMIYISFIELFQKEKNEYPIFLVDDFDTAIDSKNIEFFIDNYPDLQVIATSVNKYGYFDKSIELVKEN